MKLLFVADGRSQIALNWIGYFAGQGDEVHLASTFPCQPELRLASLNILDVAFSRSKGGSVGRRRGFWGASALRFRTALRHWLGPLTLTAAARKLAEIHSSVQPDLVHAMRIPYEGMVAALAGLDRPLIVSVWGNDFTLHAGSTPWMSQLTRRTLHRAAGLHADCWRDVHLGRAWGFPADRPAVVLPGGGGVQAELFHPGDEEIRNRGMRVINPRGFRAYVRNEAFFQAIPLVLEQIPEVQFICPAMAGEPQARNQVEALGIRDHVDLLPQVTRAGMAELFRSAMVAVSPSFHDGTPNTLLEAMACACFPVAGDLESLREWITPGVNGLLVDPADPKAIADAIVLALKCPELRFQAAEVNSKLVSDRAEHGQVMRLAREFYQDLLDIRP